MNHSKPGLNEPFYKWLDEVRRAIRKEKELKEKLAYYNVKLIGYKGVVYDRIGSAGTAGNDKDLYYWMDRIDATNKTLSEARRLTNQLDEFLILLTENERQVLLKDYLYIQEVGKGLSSNALQRNSIKVSIARKWANSMLFKT